MLEPSKFCLVRCPKCENLLQEPTESSVYQCGGCGTVLRAKKKGVLENEDLDVSDEQKIRGVSDEVEDLVVDFNAEKAKKGFKPGDLDENADKDGVFRINKLLVTEKSDAAKGMGSRTYKNRDIGSKNVTNDNWIRDSSDSRFNMDRNPNPYGGLSFDNNLKEFIPSKPVLYPRNMDRNHLLSASSNANSVEAQRGFRKFHYPDEGPSSYHGIGSYGTYTEQAKYENQLDTRAKVEILENDRAELLKKLDELAGMLKNTNTPGNEPRETGFRDPRIPPGFVSLYERIDTVKQSGTSMSYGMSNEPVSGHSYMPRGHGYDSNMDRHGSSFLGSYYRPRNPMQEYRGFGDVHNPQMLRHPYPQLPSNVQACGSFMPEPHGTSYHMPIGSCLHGSNNKLPYGHVNPVLRGPRGYVTEKPDVSELHSQDRYPLTRSPSDLGMEKTSGFGHRGLNKPNVAQKDLRVFQPFSGAAPFIACCNCFEVLKMPRKFTLTKEIRNNMMKCGACSSLLLFEFENNGMILSVPTENEQEFNDISGSNYEKHGQDFQRPRGFPNTRGSNSFDEYENFTFLENDEPKTDLGCQISDNDVDKSGHDQHSFSSMASVDEPSSDSPFDKYSDQISSDNLIDKKGQSNEIKSFGQEYKTSRQNSSKDALMATEMYVSYNDTPTKVSDQCFSDISKDSVQPRINKTADSFFKGLIKKSFRDFSKSRKITESKRTRVSVNGHVISNWIVKKAEKLAGPIQPGDYWYDYEAGFWGVMGHPCLGIILPSIDEFNYPMPESCAGGNTEIFLNGRELNQKDLDLLSSRGLPTTKHKSYLIQISGIAVDEDTGEELDLGKLAPTVEIAQHGFGMKVPRSLRKQ